MSFGLSIRCLWAICRSLIMQGDLRAVGRCCVKRVWIDAVIERKWEWHREKWAGVERFGDCWLGRNDKSWSLRCFDNSYIAFLNARSIALPAPLSYSNRVGVYLDWLALCPSSVSSGTLTHLHTFYSTFSNPLYPGFRLWNDDTSVCLCQVAQPPIWNSGQNSI